MEYFSENGCFGIPWDLLARKEFTFCDKTIMSLIYDFESKGKEFCAPVDALVDFLGVSKSTIKRSTRKLRENGYIKIYIPTGYKYNRYILTDKAMKFFVEQQK